MRPARSAGKSRTSAPARRRARSRARRARASRAPLRGWAPTMSAGGAPSCRMSLAEGGVCRCPSRTTRKGPGLPTPGKRTVTAALLHVARREDEFYKPEVTERFAARLRLRASDVEFHMLEGGHRFPSKARPIVERWLERIVPGGLS